MTSCRLHHCKRVKALFSAGQVGFMGEARLFASDASVASSEGGRHRRGVLEAIDLGSGAFRRFHGSES